MEKFRTINHKKSKGKHGFLQRSKTHSGRIVLKKRRNKARKRLTV